MICDLLASVVDKDVNQVLVLDRCDYNTITTTFYINRATTTLRQVMYDEGGVDSCFFLGGPTSHIPSFLKVHLPPPLANVRTNLPLPATHFYDVHGL